MSSSSSSKNPGLKIHTPSPSLSLPRIQPTSNSVVITPINDGFADIARGIPTSTSQPSTSGPSGTEHLFFSESMVASPYGQSAFRSPNENALGMSLSPSTNSLPSTNSTTSEIDSNPLYTSESHNAYHDMLFQKPNYSSELVTPAMLLEQLHGSSSGTHSREGSTAAPLSPMMTMGIEPSALHVPRRTVSDESYSSGDTVHIVDNSANVVDETSIGREDMQYSTDVGMMQQFNGGKWNPGQPPIYGQQYPDAQYGNMAMNLNPTDVPLYYPPAPTQPNLFDAFAQEQRYDQFQPMEYPQVSSYPPIGYPQITPPTATGFNFTGISPMSQQLSSPAHSSPSLSHPSPHSSATSSSSPFMPRNDNLHHHRNLSTASSMSIYSHTHHLSPASGPTSISPSMISGHVGPESGVDESGSSTYSPYSHSNAHSHMHTHSASQSQPYSHSHSRHASTSASGVGTSVGNITAGQWTDSFGLELGKSIDSPFPSTSTGVGGDKKRKRSSKHIPRSSISSGKDFSSLSAETFSVGGLSLNGGEDDEDVYGDSEEDEYVGVEGSDGDDEEYEIPKKGRTTKKRRVTPCSDEDPHFSPSQSKGKNRYHPGYTKDHKTSARDDHGQAIKVAVLIPITRESKSCPHCKFVPSNGRFSDLKRHHAKHLLDDANGKEKWVCTLCGDIKEESMVDEEDGVMKVMRVYYPKKGLQMQCKTYTRKDSTRRHWNKEHGDKGVIWSPTYLTMVDIVKEED